MKNIIITGGELFNKGAQAMTFLTVSELRKRFPDHTIYVLSEMDSRRDKEELENYRFNVFGWSPLKFARAQSNPALRVACLLKNRKEYKYINDIYKNADMMIDISGYALGSNWSNKNNIWYIEHLEYAMAYKIPVWIMPQSFGPFNYKGEMGNIILNRLHKVLPYARKIFAREKSGLEALINTFGLTNVRLAPDIVLSGNEIDPKDIYYRVPERKIPEIAEKAAALVPNMNLFRYAEKETVVDLFVKVAEGLRERGYSVYLIRHSYDDYSICQCIMDKIQDTNITYIDQEFSCLDFGTLVSNFVFVCGSRFHSIVHAYRQTVPCIAIGWADKYGDLLRQFSQERYLADSRVELRAEVILGKVDDMIDNYERNKRIIRNHLVEIKKYNVFDSMF